MPIPSVSITKQDGNTGVAPPSTTGVLAIIAASAAGVANTPATYTRLSDALADKGLGKLTEDAAYYIAYARKPVLLLKATTSTAASFGTVDSSGEVGTSVVTFTGAAFDEYDVLIKVLNGGTIGITGITLQYSLDNGSTFSAVTALGTASTLVLNVPRPSTQGTSGVTANFAAGTLLAGDVIKVFCNPASMTNSDLLTALAALQNTKLPWDNVLIDSCLATSTTIATVDAWLSTLEGIGRGKMAWMNTRHKNKPVPATETEAAFATAMAALVSGVSTIRVDVATDGGLVPSQVTGLLTFRPAALGIATRANPAEVGVDPAFRQQGPIPGYQLSDLNGAPLYHDEYLFPGLDALQLSTLATDPSSPGVFIGNARILSTPTSDFQFDQHARCANVALEQGYSRLSTNLSRGVATLPPDPNTGAQYIDPNDAKAIEGDCNPALRRALDRQVQGVAMILKRDDDLGSNAGALVHADLELNALRYIKTFAVNEKFVKTIAVPLPG